MRVRARIRALVILDGRTEFAVSPVTHDIPDGPLKVGVLLAGCHLVHEPDERAKIAALSGAGFARAVGFEYG